MAGIYIHIPFCRKACHYCDFHFSTSLKNKDNFLDALLKEIEIQKNYLAGERVETIYFGGGTPSLLTSNELSGIFDALDKNFEIVPDAEITLEANPDDLTAVKIKELKQTPVNRLSIGVQSFRDADLQWMNRAHNAEQSVIAVKSSQDAGFENITIDLIYGVPGMNEKAWLENLEKAAGLDIPHISAYCLTVEPKTVLDKFIKSGKMPAPEQEQAAQHFEIMMDFMRENGYEQYEISNFAKNGQISRHNSNYWLKKKYLGLGPSAHSFNGTSRQWNVANNVQYITNLEKENLLLEKEELGINQLYNEYILTSLRTAWGLDLDYIAANFNSGYRDYCAREAEKHIKNVEIVQRGTKLYLTDKGKLFADKITSGLFFID